MRNTGGIEGRDDAWAEPSADELAGHSEPADRKILHGPLCLRAPQGIGRDIELAHAVVFDSEFR